MSAVLAVETCHRTAKVDRQAGVPITQGLLRLKAGPARKVQAVLEQHGAGMAGGFIQIWPASSLACRSRESIRLGDPLAQPCCRITCKHSSTSVNHCVWGPVQRSTRTSRAAGVASLQSVCSERTQPAYQGAASLWLVHFMNG